MQGLFWVCYRNHERLPRRLWLLWFFDDESCLWKLSRNGEFIIARITWVAWLIWYFGRGFAVAAIKRILETLVVSAADEDIFVRGTLTASQPDNQNVATERANSFANLHKSSNSPFVWHSKQAFHNNHIVVREYLSASLVKYRFHAF